MRQKNYIITAKNHGNILNVVANIEADGKTMITVGNATHVRNKAQNRLMHFWYAYIAAFKEDETPVEIKAHCKYHFGVPIMQRHDDFNEAWESIRHLPYEQLMKLLEVMFPVTSLMNVCEGAEYLTTMQRIYAEDGMILPTDDDMYYAATGYKR